MSNRVFRHLTKFVTVFALLNSKTSAQDKTFSSCWDCGETVGDDTYKMCTWGGFLEDKNQVVCCPPDSTSLYCQATSLNLCTESKAEAGAKWYSYCPGILKQDDTTKPVSLKINENNKLNCGGYDQFYPYKDEQFFGFVMGNKQNDPLKPWLIQDQKPEFCYYMINKLPNWTYEDPKINLEFTKLSSISGPDLKVNVFKGDSLKTMTAVSTGAIKAGDKFDLGIDEQFIITAYPPKGTVKGAFEFKYSVSGKEYDKYWKLYYQTVKDRKYGDEYEIVGLTCAGLFVCLFFGGIGCCINKFCCAKKNKIIDEDIEKQQLADGPLDSRDGYAQPPDDSKGLHETDGAALELQSFNEDTNNEEVEPAEPKPKVQKYSRKKQEAELRNHYANPFKKHKINKVNQAPY